MGVGTVEPSIPETLVISQVQQQYHHYLLNGLEKTRPQEPFMAAGAGSSNRVSNSR